MQLPEGSPYAEVVVTVDERRKLWDALSIILDWESVQLSFEKSSAH